MSKNGQTVSNLSHRELIIVDQNLPTIPETTMTKSDLRKPCFPVRYYIAIVSALTSFMMFSSRNCLSVAIVSMTYDQVNFNSSQQSAPNHENSSVSIVPVTEKFHWTASQEGIVLGSYFYGYAAFQIMTGVLADRFNVVHLNIICNLIASVLTALVPLASHAGVLYVSIVRTIIGISHASILALLIVLFSKWFTPDEVVLPISLMSFGCNIGVAVTMPFTAWLCNLTTLGGWPLVFYSIAAVNLIIPLLWFTTVTPAPDNHPFISKYEVDYINTANSNIGKLKMKVPWLSVFSSLTIWSVIIVKGCIAVGYMIINTKIPAYLESELGMNLTSNGSFNSLLYIAISISNLAAGPIFKYLIDKNFVSRVVGRKIAESLTTFIPAIALGLIPFFGQDSTLIISLLIISTFFMGFQAAGDWPLLSEVAPDLAGSVFGICNTVSAAAGFIAPMIIGALLDSQLHHTQAWRLVFFIGSGSMIFGGLIFLFFASNEPEPWGVAPSRSIDGLSSATEPNKRSRLNKIRVHPVFSRQSSVT